MNCQAKESNNRMKNAGILLVLGNALGLCLWRKALGKQKINELISTATRLSQKGFMRHFSKLNHQTTKVMHVCSNTYFLLAINVVYSA
jgi:hypothetical protein